MQEFDRLAWETYKDYAPVQKVGPGKAVVFAITKHHAARLTQPAIAIPDLVFTRAPLVKILYTSIKDLIEAFVGDRRRFNRPVLVTLGGPPSVEALGFVTCDDLSPIGAAGRVAVYFPQSYNFAGNLVIVPLESVRPINADPGRVMAFIVSGGISGGVDQPGPNGPGVGRV